MLSNQRISVIIPVFNSMKYLKLCLDSVIAAMGDYGDAELILLDNGSTDGSYEMLVSGYADMATVYQIRGGTISALRNHGARIAQGQYLSFIDSDMVIPKTYFRAAMNVFAAVHADATGCYYDLPESPNWIEETWENLNRHRVNTHVPYLFASNFIIKKTIFDRTGGFNESMITGEDAELGLRLTTSGFKIFASSEVSAIHLRNPKTLGELFRKEAWRGLGMFGSFKWSWYDKPVLMTVAHLFLTTLGLINLFVGPEKLVFRVVILLVLSLAAPALAVIYRIAQRKSLYRPLRATLLYYVYLSARAYALLEIIYRQIRPTPTTDARS